jgi:hypothetical protein
MYGMLGEPEILMHWLNIYWAPVLTGIPNLPQKYDRLWKMHSAGPMKNYFHRSMNPRFMNLWEDGIGGSDNGMFISTGQSGKIFCGKRCRWEKSY